MRRDVRILLATLAFSTAWLVLEEGRAWLSDLGTFHVQRVEVRGARFLDEGTVIRLLDLRERTSIWEDPGPRAEQVAAHPVVRDARVGRRFPAGLVVVVDERQPVALAPTPTLEPVDGQGYRLPIDPSRYRLDLPVLAVARHPAPRARLVPSESRALLRELERLNGADTAFAQRVSEIGWASPGVLRIRWTEPAVEILVPAGASTVRLREGLAALADRVDRGATPASLEVDLRFADHVVVGPTREQRR